nr:Ig-like domain-containing protein [Corallococcus llansteffanensis]
MSSGVPVALTLEASDADGDPLTYVWTQSPASPAGTFDDASAPNPSWTAPPVDSSQRFTLEVTVSDGRGGSEQGSVDVDVRRGNQPPTVAATITGPSTLVAGATGTFTITASDPDGDPLTYTWAQTTPATPGTWVGDSTGASAHWYSPVVGTQTAFTLSVSVTDGASTPVVRTLTVPVSVPRYAADVQNVWKSVPSCTGCHDSGGLNLAAATSYSNLVNVTASACGSFKRVAPGDPDRSALIQKLEGTACGTRMPRNNPTYFNQHPDLLILVRSWILAGAAND